MKLEVLEEEMEDLVVMEEKKVSPWTLEQRAAVLLVGLELFLNIIIVISYFRW